MRELYQKGTANYPRLETDRLFADYENIYHFHGVPDQAARYIEDMQLTDAVLWKRFVDQFREEDADSEGAWRGEYWGKMMRGACFTYSYTKNPELYRVLCDTIRDMMSVQEENGRISSYAVSHEFEAWDIWARKYVILGMQYFLEICEDAQFGKEITECMCRQLDYIMGKIGPSEEGKKPITEATRHWRGLNSSSLLEPVVRLYTITGETRYFDFATYIVNCGGTDVVNIFDLAYQDELYPYQYPVTKAYEMMSCFEGLLEYSRITQNQKYQQAVIRFADKVLESDFTIIGSCGCTHELFDHSTVRQANTTNGAIAQETCVTVTLMKFLYQLTALTGDPKYIDAFEVSYYNAYLGAINTERVIEPSVLREHPDWCIEPLPFDSYSPLTAGTRGNGIGGLCVMSDMHYYGCCACIGAAGNGLFAKMALMTSENGFSYQLYADGTIESETPAGERILWKTETAYPVCGKVKISLEMKKEEAFTLQLRIPAWSKESALTVNGEKVTVTPGFTVLERSWKNGDVLEMTFDMSTEAIKPIPYGHQVLMNAVIWGKNYMVPTYDAEDPIAKNHIALRRGPLVLAQENRLGYSVDTPISIRTEADGTVAVQKPERELAPYPHIIEVCVPLQNGTLMHVTDYASAGKLWTEESKMAAWMLTE